MITSNGHTANLHKKILLILKSITKAIVLFIFNCNYDILFVDLFYWKLKCVWESDKLGYVREGHQNDSYEL